MRLSIELTEEQHKAIKTFAVMHGMSMKEFILEKVFTNELKQFNDETIKAFSDSESKKNLHHYGNLDDFITDMQDA